MENSGTPRFVFSLLSLLRDTLFFWMSAFHHHSAEEPLCIIWDCDGTLLDTEAQSSQIIADIMESVKPGAREIELYAVLVVF